MMFEIVLGWRDVDNFILFRIEGKFKLLDEFFF